MRKKFGSPNISHRATIAHHLSKLWAFSTGCCAFGQLTQFPTWLRVSLHLHIHHDSVDADGYVRRSLSSVSPNSSSQSRRSSSVMIPVHPPTLPDMSARSARRWDLHCCTWHGSRHVRMDFCHSLPRSQHSCLCRRSLISCSIVQVSAQNQRISLSSRACSSYGFLREVHDHGFRGSLRSHNSSAELLTN